MEFPNYLKLVISHTKHLISVSQENKQTNKTNKKTPPNIKEIDVDVNVTFRLGKQLIASNCLDSFPPEIMENLERSLKNIRDMSQSTSGLMRGPQDQVTQPVQHSHMIQGKAHLLSLEVMIP